MKAIKLFTLALISTFCVLGTTQADTLRAGPIYKPIKCLDPRICRSGGVGGRKIRERSVLIKREDSTVRRSPLPQGKADPHCIREPWRCAGECINPPNCGRGEALRESQGVVKRGLDKVHFGIKPCNPDGSDCPLGPRKREIGSEKGAISIKDSQLPRSLEEGKVVLGDMTAGDAVLLDNGSGATGGKDKNGGSGGSGNPEPACKKTHQCEQDHTKRNTSIKVATTQLVDAPWCEGDSRKCQGHGRRHEVKDRVGAFVEVGMEGEPLQKRDGDENVDIGHGRIKAPPIRQRPGQHGKRDEIETIPKDKKGSTPECPPLCDNPHFKSGCPRGCRSKQRRHALIGSGSGLQTEDNLTVRDTVEDAAIEMLQPRRGRGTKERPPCPAGCEKTLSCPLPCNHLSRRDDFSDDELGYDVEKGKALGDLPPRRNGNKGGGIEYCPVGCEVKRNCPPNCISNVDRGKRSVRRSEAQDSAADEQFQRREQNPSYSGTCPINCNRPGKPACPQPCRPPARRDDMSESKSSLGQIGEESDRMARREHQGTVPACPDYCSDPRNFYHGGCDNCRKIGGGHRREESLEGALRQRDDSSVPCTWPDCGEKPSISKA